MKCMKKFKDYLIKMMSDNIYNTVFFANRQGGTIYCGLCA